MKFILQLFSKFRKKLRYVLSDSVVLKFFFIFCIKLSEKLIFGKIFKSTRYIRQKNYFMKRNFFLSIFFLKNFKKFKILFFIKTFFIDIHLNYVQNFNLYRISSFFFKKKFQHFLTHLIKLRHLYEKNFDFRIKKIKKI
nr:hypothetical protein CparaKRNrm1_p087 [Cryptomonas paramecium]